MANEALEPMDADAYQNQFKPWLGEKRFRWADEQTRPGTPGIRRPARMGCRRRPAAQRTGASASATTASGVCLPT